MRTLAAIVVGLGVLPLAPAHAETLIEVPIQVSNCQSCEVFAQSIDSGGDFWDQAVRLSQGSGVLRVPVSVPSFQVSIQKGRYAGYDNSAALIVMAYRGESVGSSISNRRSRTSKAGFVCAPLAQGLAISASVRLMKTPRYRGWRKDPLFKPKYIRAWASPALPSVPSRYSKGYPLTTKKGAIAVQNVICGADD